MLATSLDRVCLYSNGVGYRSPQREIRNAIWSLQTISSEIPIHQRSNSKIGGHSNHIVHCREDGMHRIDRRIALFSIEQEHVLKRLFLLADDIDHILCEVTA